MDRAAGRAERPDPDAGLGRLSKEAKPAVVNISTKRNAEGSETPELKGRPGGRSFEEFFKRFGEVPRRPVRAAGSGFVLSPMGTS